MPAIQETKTAYLSNEDSPDIQNPIHSTVGGQQYGFQGPLVGGVTVYGWAAEVVLEVLGEEWLDHGWAEFAFKRPIYPGENLTIGLDDDDQPGQTLAVAGDDGSPRMVGRVGLGTAPWYSQLSVPCSLRPSAPLSIDRKPLTLGSAPIGETLLPVRMDMDVEAARDYAVSKQHSIDARFLEDRPRLHPAMVAGFGIMMMYRQFTFSPGIHVFSQVQHMGPAYAGPGYLTTGMFVAASERKDRHHATVDGSLLNNGVEIARARLGLVFAIEPG